MLCTLLLVNDVMYSIYVGETSQMLSTKGFKPLYLYNHFNSDNHSFEYALIMPIEQITQTATSTAERSVLVQGTLLYLSIWT